MHIIDGSFGEGGGQILRTSLGLSLLTGAPFRIEKIRAGRARPGLMRQHLTAVLAAEAVSHADVEGASIGSTSLWFRPGKVVPGDYRFSIGTAGSATLVMQTLLPSLLVAAAPSTLYLEGGTHNPMAPPFDFLALAFLPLLERMGARVRATLERPGFYPAGGGRVRLTVEPATLRPLVLVERGELRAHRATAMVSNLPGAVARRELATVEAELGWDARSQRILTITDAAGPGNVLTLAAEFEHLTEVFTGFGEKGVPAEQVARVVCDEARAYLAQPAPVGRHLADQLLIPLAIAGGGVFRTMAATPHTTTQIDMVRRFLGCAIALRELADGTSEITVGPRV